MTLAELLDRVLRGAGIRNSDLHVEIVQMLNEENNELSRDLQIPEYTVDITGVTGPTNMPTNARSGGLISIRRKADGTPYDILTVTKADLKYPGWTEWADNDPLFMAYDPATSGLAGTFQPAPSPVAGTPVDLTVTYVAKPGDMADLTDQPWDGLLAEFHEVLAFKVIYRLLQEAGDNRRQEFYAAYSKRMAEAFTYSRPQTIIAKSAIATAYDSGLDDDDD